jgi:hypothetical protein
MRQMRPYSLRFTNALSVLTQAAMFRTTASSSRHEGIDTQMQDLAGNGLSFGRILRLSARAEPV